MNHVLFPRQLRTQRLLLRCWEMSDAPILVQAITASLEQLQRWLPWALKEPQTVEEKMRTIQRFRDEFERGESFVYGMFNRDGSQLVGSIGAHGRIGAGAREIGYWVHCEETGKGYATEAAAAMVRIGFEQEQLQFIEVHCDPDNLASAAIPRKLGFTHLVTIPRCVRDSNTGPRETAIFQLHRSEFATLRNRGVLWTQDDLRDMLAS